MTDKSTRANLVGTVIFDGDDTLWDSMSLYRAAKSRFRKLMKAEGFDPREAVTILEDVDMKAAQVKGFLKSRFPESMVNTYRQLSSRHGRVPSQKVERHVRVVGRYVFRKKSNNLPYARRTLKLLHPHYRLVLLTKGTRSVQWNRIRQSGLARYFDAIYVVDTKTQAVFREILKSERLKPNEVWSVGNSFHSDIWPALALGMNAIWLDRKTWLFEDSGTVDPTVPRVELLADIPRILHLRNER